jgi:hypothetical protein
MFVGPRLITYLQQKWISFCWLSWSTTIKTILKIPWPSQVFRIDSCTVVKYWYDSTVSLTMILYISGSSVRTVVSQCQDSHSRFYLCLCMCMHFSCTALSWDASLRIMENDEIWGAIMTILCRDSRTADSRQWSSLPLSLYVYALQLHSFVVRCVVAHHGKRWDVRCHRNNSLSWQ